MIPAILTTLVIASTLVAMQTSILPAMALSAVLSLPLAALIAFAVRAPLLWTCSYAFFSGLLLDCVSPLPFGTHLVAFSCIVGVVTVLQEHFFTNKSWPVTVLLAGGAAVLYGAIVWSSTIVAAAMNGTRYAQRMELPMLWQVPATILGTWFFVYIGRGAHAAFSRIFLIRTSHPLTR